MLRQVTKALGARLPAARAASSNWGQIQSFHTGPAAAAQYNGQGPYDIGNYGSPLPKKLGAFLTAKSFPPASTVHPSGNVPFPVHSWLKQEAGARKRKDGLGGEKNKMGGGGSFSFSSEGG
jgi:hypothetical protein